jgi:cysteine synthase A
MPDTMSVERRRLLSMYGAEIVLTDGARGMQGSIEKAEEIASATEGAWIPAQFENTANPQAHRNTTGPEIWRDTEGDVDLFVAGVGTGGTLSGTGAYLKEQNPAIRIVAVEPASSPLLSEGRSGAHGLQGIGANFVPKNLDRSLIDEILPITEEEAYEAGRLLARHEGILCGITSGAALAAAIRLAKREENRDKTIVCLLPDTGDRYLSTPYFI